MGGEYGAGEKVGKGRLITTYFDTESFESGEKAIIADARILDNERNVAVVYHNPDNRPRHFFAHFKAGSPLRSNE